ncbi:MAG TPA: hypothetical protein V6C97_18135 [Oculatellaceae cyanobacterium]
MSVLKRLVLASAIIAVISLPAKAQEFLNPVGSQPASSANAVPTWLEEAQLAQQIGNRNHSSELETGPGSTNAGVLGGRTLNLNTSGNGLLAPNSVNNTPFPSGSCSDGFSMGPFYGIQPNQYGMYNGQPLPVTATSSVDLNVVNAPYTVSNYGTSISNPYGLNQVLQTINADGTERVVQFQDVSTSQSWMNAGFMAGGN